MTGHPKHVKKALDVGFDLICTQAGEGSGHTGDISARVHPAPRRRRRGQGTHVPAHGPTDLGRGRGRGVRRAEASRKPRLRRAGGLGGHALRRVGRRGRDARAQGGRPQRGTRRHRAHAHLHQSVAARAQDAVRRRLGAESAGRD
jgi:hypothetical protein